LGTPRQEKTQCCQIRVEKDKNSPALLHDLPDDILCHIRSILKKMVMEEKPYKLTFDILWGVALGGSIKKPQWERQKQAIALTTKKGVIALDRKKRICGYEVWRCEDCFSGTFETTKCFECTEKFYKEEEYYFEAPLSTLFEYKSIL
jgi:hypothetical protein